MKPVALLFSVLSLTLAGPSAGESGGWSTPGSEMKPWTRWWWLGNGVDEKNLTAQLERFAAAGLGGVEICPIYGAKGYEDRDLEFLSEKWIAMLAHTSRECERLGLGLDLTTGTGWPFGGPWVEPEMASHSMRPVKKDVGPGKVEIELPKGSPVSLMAFPAEGDPVDLMGFVSSSTLSWEAPEGEWRIRGIVAEAPVQKVKRAAPGGAGSVLDPYSPESIGRYLERFDTALKDFPAKLPRAHFHDSFEYYGADWTPGLLGTFSEMHGYDLASRLPALMGEGNEDEVARVGHDYRETLDQLHRSYLSKWRSWTDEQGSMTRNQAHGSPGNLLDHYAVAGIPETEIFRHVSEDQIPMLQFAASAAHVTGKPLVSAESFTWLGEHFQVRPETLKAAADFLWIGGVNHIFYHGIPYSPEDAGWPGWLFYASTHMGENGGLWRGLPEFNDYITRVQSELQKGSPDTSVLLYFPVHDIWSGKSDGLQLLTIHAQDKWLQPMPFYEAAMSMWNRGIPCDFVSDLLLESAEVRDGKIVMGGSTFETLVVPETNGLPLATAERLVGLAAAGASIAFLGDVPTEVPGVPSESEEEGLPVLLGNSSGIGFGVGLSDHLSKLGIEGEPMSERRIRFVRRKSEDGYTWFVVNRSEDPVDEWIPLGVPCASAEFLDPSRPDRFGTGEVRQKEGRAELRFVLGAGESRILRTSTAKTERKGPEWVDYEASGPALPIEGPWNVRFLEGGPKVPAVATIEKPASWAGLPGDDYRNFSGSAVYSTTFGHSAEGAFLLDLGKVAETCRVRLNGKEIGRSFFPPHRFDLSGSLKTGENVLEVEVTNLAANRIADLDRRKVAWKSFHEINFVNIDYKSFDASDWPPLESGLIGPVVLIPLK